MAVITGWFEYFKIIPSFFSCERRSIEKFLDHEELRIPILIKFSSNIVNFYELEI